VSGINSFDQAERRDSLSVIWITLSPKQARFVEEYVVDLDGKQAAIRAEYSAKTAEVQAS
jgi:hypothetical protein